MRTLQNEPVSNRYDWAVRLGALAGLLVFACAVIEASIALVLSALIFDAPDSISNPLAWNLALAPLAVIAAYVYAYRIAVRAYATGDWRHLWQWLQWQLLGLAWVATAYGLIDFVCAGSLSCR
jgi:hypothetical protein